jgi:hypothetical protein
LPSYSKVEFNYEVMQDFSSLFNTSNSGTVPGDYDATCRDLSGSLSITSNLNDPAVSSDVHTFLSPPSPHYVWDFASCSGDDDIVYDAIGGELRAFPNSTKCHNGSGETNVAGWVFGGDAANSNVGALLESWEIDGPVSFEVNARYDVFEKAGPVFEFSYEGSDIISLRNEFNRRNIESVVDNTDGEVQLLSAGDHSPSADAHEWANGTWTHIVVTISEVEMVVYKDGVRAASYSDSGTFAVPAPQERVHLLGASMNEEFGGFRGALRYLKVWTNVVLNQDDVTELFSHYTDVSMPHYNEASDAETIPYVHLRASEQLRARRGA